jgi:hypothetical protein
LTITGANNSSFVKQGLTSQSAGAYCFSFYTQANTSRLILADVFVISGDGSNRVRGFVNTDTKAITYISQTGTATLSVYDGAYGFLRVVIQFSSTNLTSLECRIGPNTAGPVAVWGANLTKDSLSSYIPATTAATTRFADAASMTGLPTAGVTLIEKPAGCATLSAGTLTLNTGYTVDRIMVLPGTYSADQITTIRGLM